MSSKQRANLTLLALAISAFAIGSTEFISVGLMPLMIKDFGITMSQAGLTVSMYALGITIGAPILAILTSRWPRKNLLLGIMVVFIIGNLTVAFAPVFAVVLVGRIISSLAHGIFMSIASVVAADVVEPERRASAIAVNVHRLDGGDRDWGTTGNVHRSGFNLAHVVYFYRSNRCLRPCCELVLSA